MDWTLFATTFGLIFIAEVPDKTAFATLLLATRHGAFPVFLGAASAFVIQSLVAVAFGSVISLLPARWVHAAAGVLFLVFAVMMWREKTDESGRVKEEGRKFGNTFWGGVVTAFMVIFIAEWGDLTQLATATLQAKYHQPLTIFTAATLALWSVTALGSFVGHHAKKAIHPERLQKIAAVIFAAVGIVFLFKI